MTTGARKIEIPHIQRNINLDQVVLSASMFSRSPSISICSIDLDGRAEVRGIWASCSPAAVSVSDGASPAGNDISMDHSEFILLLAVKVRLRNGARENPEGLQRLNSDERKHNRRTGKFKERKAGEKDVQAC
jgi:hypothetical protein